MPTREEQIAQVEAALRRRFFPLVPKLVRAGWTEEDHDKNRLSRSLAGFTLVGACEIDDVTAAGAITDGTNDGGIDAFYYDRAGNHLVLVQSKFKRNGDAPSQADTLKTINGVKALQDRRFDEFNEAFRSRLDEVEEALDTPGVSIEMMFVFLGEALGPHATNDLNAFQVEMNSISPCINWKAAGLPIVYNWLLAEQAPSAVNDQVELENWTFITTPRKAVYGQVSAASLAQLVERHGKKLFERNIRYYLGSVGVNTAIERTVRSRPEDFFYLNNGITAVAEAINKAPGNPSRCVFGLTKVSIVNGAQTAGAIANAATSTAISPNAKLLLTIIEIGAQEDDIGRRITIARNLQNVVRGVYFAALDPNQERLRQELASAGITYYYRPSAEARVPREDAFTLEQAAVAMACLSFPVLSTQQLSQPSRPSNAVDFVVTAKKEIGRLWEQDGAPYAQLFPGTLSGLRMCRFVRIYRFIDHILAPTEWSETSYQRRMFFRHGRYFIMAFVAHRSPEVLATPQLGLSEADQNVLSQRINELAEIIYAESTPLQSFKGYLSIFRNLTDSQPLADGVLRRLAEQDRQQAPAVPASASTPNS
jgi:AIPR protein